MKGPRRDIGASVRTRLTLLAQAGQRDVQEVMTRYVLERLLYRLSVSRHREAFVLKGAMLFTLWAQPPWRATRDLDLLGYGDASPAAVASTFREICTTPVADDGVAFAPDAIRAEPVRCDEEYEGVRLTFKAVLARARLPVQVDIGFGDAVTPGPRHIEYPSLLQQPAAKLLSYPPETVVAEKYRALVALGLINSRLKDFYDLWVMSQTFSFDGGILAAAVAATFQRRETPLPMGAPHGLTSSFSQEPSRQRLWRAFVARASLSSAPESLSGLVANLAQFLVPVSDAAAHPEPFSLRWPAGGPWGHP